jgi:hypothetical protein
LEKKGLTYRYECHDILWLNDGARSPELLSQRLPSHSDRAAQKHPSVLKVKLHATYGFVIRSIVM